MAQAKPVEKWECRDYAADNWKTILVKATVDSGRASGTIEVAGVTWYASFQVEGFDRRWDFGPKDYPTRYGFAIEPDGDGFYFDFKGSTGKISASSVMKCRQR